LAGGDGDPEHVQATPAKSQAATASVARLIVAIPEIGRLTWRCDGARRFSTTLRTRSATVYATTVSDGKRLWRLRRVDPPPSDREPLSTPYEHVSQQTWRISWRHEPATIRATVRIRFAVSRIGECYAARASTDTRTTPN
jgi:hypothetical protein